MTLYFLSYTFELEIILLFVSLMRFVIFAYVQLCIRKLILYQFGRPNIENGFVEPYSSQVSEAELNKCMYPRYVEVDIFCYAYRYIPKDGT